VALGVQCPGLYLAGAESSFVERIGEALASGAGPRRARSLAMAEETWDAKVEEIEERLLRL
jgi:hypothetical protein